MWYVRHSYFRWGNIILICYVLNLRLWKSYFDSIDIGLTKKKKIRCENLQRLQCEKKNIYFVYYKTIKIHIMLHQCIYNCSLIDTIKIDMKSGSCYNFILIL